MSRARVLCFLICLVMATAITVGSAPAPTDFTVGDFAVLIASRINTDESIRQITPEQAVEILANTHVKIEGDLAAAVTETDAADILGQFGITLQASPSGDLLDQARANALLSIFGETLVATTSKNTSHLAVKAGTSSSRNSLGTAALENGVEDCQQLPHDCSGQPDGCETCHKCCSQIFPPGGGSQSQFCGKFCQKKNLTSATDPTP